MNYEVEQKRHWRYWVWKRIAENCGVHPSFATVLFLSGPSPSDLQAATKYGFKLRNIVAVDMNAECVEAARKAGCTAIQGSLHEVVAKWTDGTIHGVVADYCCGLTFNVALESFQIAMLCNSHAFNFQRGRETDEVSKLLRETYSCKDRAILFKIFSVLLWDMWDHYTHAGEQKFYGFIRYFLDSRLLYTSEREHFISRNELLANRVTAFREYVGMALKTSKRLFPEAIYNHLEKQELSFWQTMSYRSNVVKMDSIVGSLPQLCHDVTAGQGKADRGVVDRRLAAVKAIRTMNGAVKMHATLN